jgi:flagellar hook assembly protein FlgD
MPDPIDAIDLRLGLSHPNPFSGSVSATIPFTLSHRSDVSVKIFDASGRQVRVLLQQVLESGEHRVSWDGRDDRAVQVPAGIYFYKLETRGFKATRAMVKLRQ